MKPLVVLDTASLVKCVLTALAIRHRLPPLGWQRMPAAQFLAVIDDRRSN